MSLVSLTRLARTGYDAYGEWSKWKLRSGKPRPTWEQLSPHQKLAWIQATAAILRANEGGSV